MKKTSDMNFWFYQALYQRGDTQAKTMCFYQISYLKAQGLIWKGDIEKF